MAEENTLWRLIKERLVLVQLFLIKRKQNW